VDAGEAPAARPDRPDEIPIPEPPPGTLTKDDRYYVAYSLDQYLYWSTQHPEEGVGLFGQFGISDGNPTSGTGKRSRVWGAPA
jgi:hypothetical protein